MKCNKLTLLEQGKLEYTSWVSHAKTCPTCREMLRTQEAVCTALTAPAAPAELVDKVFAKTTRKRSWLTRWRAALASGVAVLLVAVGAVYHVYKPQPFNATDLVAYMHQDTQDEYDTFLSDLDIFEQEF